MKKIHTWILLFSASCTLGLSSLRAQEALPIINVISSGDVNTSEITFDGETICVGNDQGIIRRLAPNNGEVIEVLKNEAITTCGLEYDGEYFIAEAYAKDRLYYLETSDLEVVDSIVPDSFNGYIHGIAWDGALLWYTIFHFGTTDTIYAYDPETMTTEKAPFMDEYSKGVAFDGEYIWISDNSNQSKPLLYKIDRNTFEEVEVYLAPGGKYPNGMTFDGQYLWVSNNQTDSIYQLDIGLETYQKAWVQEQDHIQAYPNPCRDQLFLEFEPAVIGKNFAIYNEMGALIEKRKILHPREVLNTSLCTPGKYFIYIDSKLEELVLMVD